MRNEFPAKVKVAAYERSQGHCEGCGMRLSVGRFAYDHIIADGLTGAPTLENCQVLCTGPGSCHDFKTRKQDVPAIAKAKRREAKHIGAKAPSRNPLPGSKSSPWKRTFSKGWVPRD